MAARRRLVLRVWPNDGRALSWEQRIAEARLAAREAAWRRICQLAAKFPATCRATQEEDMSVAVLKSAAVKAVRTFCQAFLATLAVSAAGIVDVSTGRAAVVAAVSAGIAAAWRTALDTLPAPTLVDRNNEAGVPAGG